MALQHAFTDKFGNTYDSAYSRVKIQSVKKEPWTTGAEEDGTPIIENVMICRYSAETYRSANDTDKSPVDTSNSGAFTYQEGNVFVEAYADLRNVFPNSIDV